MSFEYVFEVWFVLEYACHVRCRRTQCMCVRTVKMCTPPPQNSNFRQYWGGRSWENIRFMSCEVQLAIVIIEMDDELVFASLCEVGRLQSSHLIPIGHGLPIPP